jgi:urea-proton symporter
MGLCGLIFYYIGVSMGWLYVRSPSLLSPQQLNADQNKTFMGVILGGAVVPISMCITSKRANKWGCVLGAVAGFAAGIIAWLVATATLNDGIINVTVRFPPLFH